MLQRFCFQLAYDDIYELTAILTDSMRLFFILMLLCSIAHGQDKTEVLNFNASKLNDSIPGYLTKKKLLAQLGNPTKIENYDPQCALTDEQEKAKVKKLYYSDKTRFFIFDNKAELTLIDFRSGRFSYQTDKIRLTNATTLKDLQKVYPKSVKAAFTENGGKLIRLKPCKDCDGQCLLYFENGKLIHLEWWEEC